MISIDKASNDQTAHFLLLGAAFLAIFLDLAADFFLGADFFAEDFLAGLAFGLAGEAAGLAGEALGLGAAFLTALGLGAAFLAGAALGLDLDAALFD